MFAVVELEYNDRWTWFLVLLRDAIVDMEHHWRLHPLCFQVLIVAIASVV